VSAVAFGVFDVFAYAVPGALYLTLILYVLARTEHLDVGLLLTANTVLATIGVLLASYLLGHVTYLPRLLLDRWTSRWLRVRTDARAEFARRVPQAADREFLRTDSFFLARAIELEAAEAGTEINRLRAGGIALRNCGYALVLAGAVAVVEIGASGHHALAVVAAVLLPAAGVSSLRAGFVQGHWAAVRTYEVAYWLPSIEERLSG
jgi:hypothetical protein